MGTQKNCLNETEHPKDMLKLMGKRISSILRSKILLINTFVVHSLESKDKDKDKEALFKVAYNVTDNISS